MSLNSGMQVSIWIDKTSKADDLMLTVNSSSTQGDKGVNTTDQQRSRQAMKNNNGEQVMVNRQLRTDCRGVHVQ